MYEMEGLPWPNVAALVDHSTSAALRSQSPFLAGQSRTSGHSVFALPKVDSGPSCRHW
jgi:hypothetical protein